MVSEINETGEALAEAMSVLKLELRRANDDLQEVLKYEHGGLSADRDVYEAASRVSKIAGAQVKVRELYGQHLARD